MQHTIVWTGILTFTDIPCHTEDTVLQGLLEF